MAYTASRIGVEYDGAKWHGDFGQMQHDATRRRRLEDAGWRIITGTAVDVRDPAALIASVRQEMALRGA
jgi:very-short-patch-repair endonuclease